MDSPYPGIATSFESHYGQSWTDPDWRNETSVWAAAWKIATDKAVSPSTSTALSVELAIRRCAEVCVDLQLCWLKAEDKKLDEKEYGTARDYGNNAMAALNCKNRILALLQSPPTLEAHDRELMSGVVQIIRDHDTNDFGYITDVEKLIVKIEGVV